MCCVKERCCFCLSLADGGKIISIIATMLAALFMVLYGSAAAVAILSPMKMNLFVAMSVAFGTQVVCGLLAIYGAFWTQPLFLKPWIIVAWLEGVVLVLYTVVGAALFHGFGIQVDIDTNLVFTIGVVYGGILIYFAMVMQSRRKEMILVEMEPAKETTTSLMNPALETWRYV